jgi:hypothetical protein
VSYKQRKPFATLGLSKKQQTNKKDKTMNKEIINEIINRLEKVFKMELKMRKEWVKEGFQECDAPSAIGLIGTAKTGYECLRSAWWAKLGCGKLVGDSNYNLVARQVEATAKIKNLSFGS